MQPECGSRAEGGSSSRCPPHPLPVPPPACFRPCTATSGGNGSGSRQTSPGLTWRTGMGESMPKPLTCTSPSPWPSSSSWSGTSLRRESLFGVGRDPEPPALGAVAEPWMCPLVPSLAGGAPGVPTPSHKPSPHKHGVQGAICWANNGNRPGFVGRVREGGAALQGGDSRGQRDLGAPLGQNPPWSRCSRMGTPSAEWWGVSDGAKASR